MFKETPEGQTNSCEHETTNESGICNRCLGKDTNCHYEDRKCQVLSCPGRNNCEEMGHFDISPSDKTWRQDLWGLLYDEYGDIRQNGNISDFIQDLLTSATIKAREEVLNGLVNIVREGSLESPQEKSWFISNIYNYAKSQGIKLEEPKS